MIFYFLIWACGIALPAVGSFTFWKVNHPWEFYIPIVLFVAGLLAGLLLDVIFILCAGLPYAIRKKDYVSRPSRFATKILGQGIVWIDTLARLKIKISGKNKLPKYQKYLIVCNHRSNFDPMVMIHKVARSGLQFISKPSNFKIPLAGPFMKGSGFLAIERDNREQSLEIMKKSMDLISSGKASVAVFPEGTRQREEIIGDFHEGVFNIAIHTGAPVVIACIDGTELIHKRAPWRRTLIRIKIIGVIPPDELDNYTAKSLSDTARELMIENLSH